MTGLPATFTSGLGTRLVSGRSRVPLPAIGMMTFMSGHSSVAVLEPNDVVQLRRGSLQEIGHDDGLELVDLFGRNVKRLAGAYALLAQRLALLDPQDDLAGEHVDRLILLVVVLQREHVPRLDMEDLPDVAVGFRPDDLVTPRLVDPVGDVHASLSFKEEGKVTHAVTHTPQPTHPSGFSTGCPRSSSASAFSPIGHARAQTPHSAP